MASSTLRRHRAADAQRWHQLHLRGTRFALLARGRRRANAVF
jgi:hypothetical protein